MPLPIMFGASTQATNIQILTGIKGDGSDEAPLVQAALNALPDGGTLVYYGNAVISITSTIIFQNRKNIVFACASPFVQKPQPQGTFNWIGQDGGTVMSFDHAYECMLFGWLLTCNNADIGVSIDGDPTAILNLTSSNRLEYVSIRNSGHRATWVGCQIAATSVQNCELMTFRGCNFDGDGSGLGIGLHQASSGYNAHGHTIDGCTFQFLDTGYRQANGGVRFIGVNDFSQNNTSLHILGGEYPTDISGINSEHANGFAIIGGGNWNSPIKISNCRISALNPITGSAIQVIGGGPLEVSHNLFYGITKGSGAVYDLTQAIPDLQLTRIGNVYGGSAPSVATSPTSIGNKIVIINEFNENWAFVGLDVNSAIPDNIQDIHNSTIETRNFIFNGVMQAWGPNCLLSGAILTFYSGLSICTDTGTISTITPANSIGWNEGIITIKFTNTKPPVFNITGNIDRACTPAVNQIVSFAYDPISTKWAPSI
jgi:hypothetical protein